MKTKHWGVLLSVGLLTGCGNPIKPCGYFEFFFLGSTPPIGNLGASAAMNENFTFQNYDCNSNCSAKTIAYLEAVKVWDLGTGEILQPSSTGVLFAPPPTSGLNEAELNGWWINNPQFSTSGQMAYPGYYGQEYGGAFDPTYISTGTNVGSNTPAQIHLFPGYVPADTWYMAIDAAVCINGDSDCKNQALGYEFWLLPTDTSGNPGTPFNETGVQWNYTAVAMSVQDWNLSNFGASFPLPVFGNLH